MPQKPQKISYQIKLFQELPIVTFKFFQKFPIACARKFCLGQIVNNILDDEILIITNIP